MPIRPENKNRYPKNWKEISKDKLERAGYKCEICGLKQYSVGIRIGERFIKPVNTTILNAISSGEGINSITGERLRYKEAKAIANVLSNKDAHYSVIVLTVMHLDHIPENCDDGNLKAGCQRCHLMYDMKERIRKIKARKYQGNLKLSV